MDDEKIFGPLSLRQFLYSGAGILIIYFLYNNLEKNISLPFVIFVALITLTLVIRSKPHVMDEKYIEYKKAELGNEKFTKWARQKIAMLEFQIQLRKQRGLIDDPSLTKTKESLETLIK